MLVLFGQVPGFLELVLTGLHQPPLVQNLAVVQQLANLNLHPPVLLELAQALHHHPVQVFAGRFEGGTGKLPGQVGGQVVARSFVREQAIEQAQKPFVDARPAG